MLKTLYCDSFCGSYCNIITSAGTYINAYLLQVAEEADEQRRKARIYLLGVVIMEDM